MMEKIDQNEASGWTTNDLGELPDTSYVGDGSGYAYTEADMYAYALTQVRRAVAAERGRLSKDAERYQKLKRDFGAASLDINGNHSWVYRRNFSLHGPTLDAAIDAQQLVQPNAVT